MTIGLSTYAFFWQWHPTAATPLGLDGMLATTAEWGATALQVCDYPKIESYDASDLRSLAADAGGRGVILELGTRGIAPDHLARYLDMAQRLDVTLVRSMIPADQAAAAEELLELAIPAYEKAGVALALETYEQVPTTRLMEVVERIDSPYLGVCLDPANGVAALESPAATIAATADRVLNLHVKDFAFTRAAGWVGFTYAGARLGEGLLDYDGMIAAVRPDERGIAQIVEHWLVWQGDSVSTCLLEREWTQHSLAFLQARQPARQPVIHV